MAKVPLSVETERRVAMVFRDVDVGVATEMLVEECGGNLPFCGDSTPEELERIRYAAMKLSNGCVADLRRAIELAKTDWRDLLMGAGFGHDIHAHLRWVPDACQDRGG
jgi:hypothetical protein